jgi:glutamate synthase domain-containing protein 2
MEWAAQRIINLFASWRVQLVEILGQLGMRSIKELVGRTDCLIHLDYVSEEQEKVAN